VSRQPEDQRRAARVPRVESISVELRPRYGSDPLDTRVVSTQTVDLSADGLRIRLASPVDPGCLLELCVVLRGCPRLFLLTGESRWCRPARDGDGFEAGFLIYDGQGTDYPDWAALFSGAS